MTAVFYTESQSSNKMQRIDFKMHRNVSTMIKFLLSYVDHRYRKFLPVNSMIPKINEDDVAGA